MALSDLWSRAGLSGSSEPRVWRHLDTCQFKTFLHARVPRVECPEHGVLQVKVPWAEAKGRFTMLMERLIIDVLRECATVAGTCRLMRISWDEAWNVMARAVRRGQARKKANPTRYLGIDEKAFRKGHDYMTVVCDLLGGTVVSRKKSAPSFPWPACGIFQGWMLTRARPWLPSLFRAISPLKKSVI